MRLAAAFTAAALLACSGPGSSLLAEAKPGKTAEETFKAGEAELKAGNHLEATKLFENVRTKYPFSRFAALSELRLADVKFDQERWSEAAEAYREFVKLHPNHENVDYAAFRVGQSYWKDAPSNFKLLPPSYEKDQQTVRDAVDALKAFPEKYPSSKHRAEAERILAEARDRLIEHEWYVADFYAKRGRWAGAAGRLEGLLKSFPNSPREADALLKLAEAYEKLEERTRAQQALQQLIVKHPESPRRAEAERLLARLR
jgi:outer membrane protein assembly factor BamD